MPDTPTISIGQLVSILGRRVITIAELQDDSEIEQAAYTAVHALVRGLQSGILPAIEATAALFPERLRAEYLHLALAVQSILDGVPTQPEYREAFTYELQ